MDVEMTQYPPFTVTPEAVSQIESLGGSLAINVEVGGCCGFTFVFDHTTDPESVPMRNTRFGCPGAWLIADARVVELLRGATLDYSARIKPPRFRVIKNPNTEYVCSCRRSFGKPWPGPGQPECRAYMPMPWDKTFEPPDKWIRQTEYHSARSESDEDS